MQIGMIGLGKMGGNMVTRLLRNGHHVVAYDRSADAVDRSAGEGAAGARTLEELVAELTELPRAVWVMVPAGDPTSSTIRRLSELCQPGDIVIDGGNTNWRDALLDAEVLKRAGLNYLDAGTSGGIWGLKNGYCLMIGGPQEAYERCEPVFRALAPEDGGLVHTGPEGSGHFVKMVHNGIEYALMQAYAEGFEIMKQSTAYPGMDMHAIAEAWRSGSVVRSWLLDLIADGLSKDPDLADIKGYVEDTGEGRWTVAAAIDEAVPAPTITMALYERFRSRMDDTFADKMLAMMRNQFGGHAVKTTRP
ncbi:MAG TPA: decarboxylating 6-phosphogluconate dehydrogenase [Terriglobales bacterium]|nr:decarboxylating 6-phosphogluconate dehydrogenase [Candidatus Dormibacteraeota bacterium]HYW22623.1 decarboxylating 6-phosphogluconate dehydrogenase [Terriglobales bacterium]